MKKPSLTMGVAMLALASIFSGCETSTTEGDNSSINESNPHNFTYDSTKKEYVVNGTIIPESEVKRDMSGKLCMQCHKDAIAEFKNSVHYSLIARTDRVMFPGGGAHGAIDRACGLPGTSAMVNYTSDKNLGECAKCHAGRYLPVMEGAFASLFNQMGLPEPQQQAANIVESGIDCLVCHASVYKSAPEGNHMDIADNADTDDVSPTSLGYAKVAHDNSDFDQDGIPDPQIDATGDGEPDTPLMMDTNGDNQPDTPWPTLAQDRNIDAVRSIGKTSEETCLRCHEHARTGYKRATLYEEGYDVHATLNTGPFAGVENRCTTCHKTEQHKFVRGHNVGGDLAAADFPPPLPGVETDPQDPTNIMCTTCHTPESLQNAPELEVATGRKTTVHSDKHINALACETCHIPVSGGITYSLYGDGSHLSFGRNENAEDTKLISADHMKAEDRADIDSDFAAYQSLPTLMWFNGGSSFLAQSLAVRGSPNAKITPFKPMANGMMFDARFFAGDMSTQNDDGIPYNAHSMYRFYANKDDASGMGNAEAFAAMDMLDLTPTEVRQITLNDFFSENPDKQAMAMMQIFPNMIQFDKAVYGYEHYLISAEERFKPWDANGDGILDSSVNFHFDRLAAAQAGLNKFKGFNGPMGFPLTYDWYPPFTAPDELVTMKLPDGSLMKMFLQMQARNMAPADATAYLAAVENYPAFSNGVTLGGHGVRPKEQALGYGEEGCKSCHGSEGRLTKLVPVTEKQAVDMGTMGTLEFPKYRWHFYNIHRLANLGLAVSDEDVVNGTADIDISGDDNYQRVADSAGATMLLNWFAPTAPGGYQPATNFLIEASLTADDLTQNGGSWMPILEPVTNGVPNYAVLGYEKDELIWATGGGNP